jgi:hypothetical protein
LGTLVAEHDIIISTLKGEVKNKEETLEQRQSRIEKLENLATERQS